MERQRLLRHSSAAIWTATRAEVVGGCGEGCNGGGYDREVGLMKAIQAGTSEETRPTDFAGVVWPFVVTSIITSSSIGTVSDSSHSSTYLLLEMTAIEGILKTSHLLPPPPPPLLSFLRPHRQVLVTLHI